MLYNYDGKRKDHRCREDRSPAALTTAPAFAKWSRGDDSPPPLQSGGLDSDAVFVAPYICDVCSRVYRRYSSICRHLIMKHGRLFRRYEPSLPLTEEEQKNLRWDVWLSYQPALSLCCLLGGRDSRLWPGPPTPGREGGSLIWGYWRETEPSPCSTEVTVGEPAAERDLEAPAPAASECSEDILLSTQLGQSRQGSFCRACG